MVLSAVAIYGFFFKFTLQNNNIRIKDLRRNLSFQSLTYQN